jgi:hypothetical protein
MFLKFYYSCSALMFLLCIICNYNLIIYFYFRLNLLFFSFLIIPCIFNITRSFVLYYYLIDYLKYILDKNLYNRVSPLGKIILPFILFLLFFVLFSFIVSDIKLLIFLPLPSFSFSIPIMPPVIYTFYSPSLKTFDASDPNTMLSGSTFMLFFPPEIRQAVLL